MITRLMTFGRRWVSDSHVRQHEPELSIVLAQLILIVVPIILAALLLLVALP